MISSSADDAAAVRAAMAAAAAEAVAELAAESAAPQHVPPSPGLASFDETETTEVCFGASFIFFLKSLMIPRLRRNWRRWPW
jgi:hypothetical protein